MIAEQLIIIEIQEQYPELYSAMDQEIIGSFIALSEEQQALFNRLFPDELFLKNASYQESPAYKSLLQSLEKDQGQLESGKSQP